MMTLCNKSLFVVLPILYFLTTSFPLVSASSLSIPSASSTHKHSPWKDSNKFTTYQPGQNYKGLSKVKSYFYQLGYIPNMAPSNFDDKFDDKLVSAIQTYQKNYKLSPTGKLDNNTVRQLMTPRCGAPDIINTNTNTSFGSDNNIHSLHTVSRYTYFDGMPRWRKGTTNLNYAYAPGLKFNDATKSLFARAFNRWTQVVNIAFTETASYATSNIKIDFLSWNHGDGYPFDGKYGTWAHAFSPPDGNCHFDADEYWEVDDASKSPEESAVDLESVAVHEFGHLLGLFHSSDETAIMYAYINPRTRKVDLTPDDIEGVQYLYRDN